jgi:predicted RNA-binding protein with PUA-like domain
MGRFNVHDLDPAAQEKWYQKDIEFLTQLRAAQTLDEVRAIRKAQGKPISNWKEIALRRAVKRVCVKGVSK